MLFSNHEDHPFRSLAWVPYMFKTIHVRKCCVEVPYILSNGAGEETRRKKKNEVRDCKKSFVKA